MAKFEFLHYIFFHKKVEKNKQTELKLELELDSTRLSPTRTQVWLVYK